MTVALAWVEPIAEATGDEAKKLKAAALAASDVLKDRDRLDGDAVDVVTRYMLALKADLESKLLGGAGSLTDFSRRNVTALLRDVDRLVSAATRGMLSASTGLIDSAATLGEAHAAQPLAAAGLQLTANLPGLDERLIRATYGNMAELLTAPMQQFTERVKTQIRAVANAGDSTFGAIANLRDAIAGQGFDDAQYKAERIIRTEVGRIFNESSHTRLESLSTTFPFIRKCWRDSHDNRVRKGHQEAGRTYARGHGIPIADLFVVNVYKELKSGPVLMGEARLRFPVDPEAEPAGRLAAGATIMCRCNSFIDFEATDFRAYSRARIATILGPHVHTPPPPSTFRPHTPTHVTVPDTAHPNVSGLLPGSGTPVPMS